MHQAPGLKSPMVKENQLKLALLYVTGLRLCPHWKNMWLRMIYCLQIIWQENRKFEQRLWSATIPHREDMVQVGCD